jgi:hypothetical protein
MPSDPRSQERVAVISMAVKPLTRTELIQLVLFEADELSARQLLTNFPAVTRSFPDLVSLVCQGERLTPDLFDTLCAAWKVIRPDQSMDALQPTP